MTEAEWLACDNPQAMLETQPDCVNERKTRLFGCACLRAAWEIGRPTEPDVTDQRQYRTVELAEEHADGQASFEALRAAYEYACQAPRPALRLFFDWGYVCCVPHAVSSQVTSRLCGGFRLTLSRWGTWREQWRRAWKKYDASVNRLLAELLRELLGNPFRSAVADPTWRSRDDCTVLRLAHAIYHERAFDRMPILADALEDVGCADPDILSHLRGPGPHFRGCWVVDLLLGKS
jgi:hypothetical protein